VKDGADGAIRTGEQSVEQLRRLPALKTEKTNYFLIAKVVDHVLVKNLKIGLNGSAGNNLNLGERWGRWCLQDR
jgi:hypothetical protein